MGVHSQPQKCHCSVGQTQVIGARTYAILSETDMIWSR